MARLQPVTRDQVAAAFQDAFDEVTADSGGVITGGPGSITINSPEMAKRRNHLTHYLRYETTFAKRIQELAILLTARAMDCPYIWNAHAPAARQAGLSDTLIDAIRDRQPLPDMAPDEAALVAYGQAFFETHTVSPGIFQAALAQFGSQHLVELTQLMGQYTQTAFFLNAFAVELPTDRTEKLLPV
jgi:4-carboxymuconolactone decarboxylase